MLRGMVIRNRNQEIRRVRVGDLLANPANHRLHPAEQKAALRGVLAEVGFVGTLLAFKQSDGRLRLIDGHLRQESLAPDDEVDVTIVDLEPAERDKILAVHDALGAAASIDREKLDALIAKIRVESPAIIALLDRVSRQNQVDHSRAENTPDGARKPRRECKAPELWQVVVTCGNETEQRDVYELLSAKGLSCRLLAL